MIRSNTPAPRQARRFGLISSHLCWLGALASLTGGCGGSSSSGPDEIPREQTSGGTEVTEEAREAWVDAVEVFRELDTNGRWNAQTCERAANGFAEANEEQGGAFTEALFMSGLVAQRCGDDGRAREFFERALSANDKYCEARAAIGVMQMDEGQVGPAEQTFRRALRDDPRCTEAYVNLAVIQRQRGGADVREALNNLRRALAIESRYLPAFNQMALLYLKLGRESEQPTDARPGGSGVPPSSADR